MGLVPTIDLRGPGPTVAAEIDAACTEVGFFQVVGHGVDAGLERAAWSATLDFFALPDDHKRRLTIRTGDAYGYGPFRSERLAASLGDTTPPDLKETFSIGPAPAAAQSVDDPAAAFVFSPTPWPDVDGFATTMREYYDALAALVDRVMSLMATGLGMPADAFADAIDRHTSALRLLRYPDLAGTSVEPGQLRAGAHSDYGTLTLLRQQGGPGGLQVTGRDGEWHDVPPVPDAYVVNVGDALARWTNDRWRSTLHRVVIPPGPDGLSERTSIAFFHNANWDAVIECLPACLVAGEAPRYPPVTAGRHLMDKFRSTQ